MRSSAGGGTPGLAIGSLIAFVALLGGMALLAVRPWDANSVVPLLRVGPGIGIDLGDAIAVAGEGPSVAEARVAKAGNTTLLVDDRPVASAGTTQGVGLSPNRPASQPPAPTGQAPEGPKPSPDAGDTPEIPASNPAPAPEPTQLTPVVAAMSGPRGGSAGSGRPPLAGGIVCDADSCNAIPFEIREGQEYLFSFSFYIEAIEFGESGAEDAILRIIGNGTDSPSLGLQLWEYPGEDWYGTSVARGLWASGEAMGGDRFLTAVSEHVWHEVAIQLEPSSEGAGFYELFLDGRPLDARDGVSLIEPGSEAAQIEVGLFREGRVVGTSEVRIDSAALTEIATLAEP